VGEYDLAAVAEVVWASMVDRACAAGVESALPDPELARARIRHLLDVDPSTGMLAELGGRVVAVGWVHPRGRVATIGLLAVRPMSRGMGLGAAMLARLAEAVGPRNAQLRHLHDGLSAVGLVTCLQAGFRVVAPVLEFVLPADRPCGGTGPSDGTVVRAATTNDRWQVVERDARAFGARREQDVDHALAYGRVAVAERGGRTVGHVLARRLADELLVGTGAADDPSILLALIADQVAAGRHGMTTARLQVPATDQQAVLGLVDAGFRLGRLSSYLVRGGGTSPPRGYLLMPPGRC
jgi:predicted N-acetyltransferase YhbS